MVSEPLKLAIVTGTSSGIGAGLTQALLDENWVVVGLARRNVDLQSPHYTHIRADLSDIPFIAEQVFPDLIQKLHQSTWERIALVNNAAAIGSLKGLGEISPQELTTVYNVNVIAAGIFMGLVSKHVPDNTWLRILNVSTGAVHRGIPGLADYAGSKAALRLTGMTLASEFEQFRRSKAAILSYEPGIVDTEMQVTARTSTEGFPSQKIFQGFHSSGSLQPVSAVIIEMLKFLGDVDSPSFTESRFVAS